MARKDLKPEDITAICDTREQAPLDLFLKTERGTLKTADYSVKGLENIVAIERKGLTDLLMCVGRERDRFEACVQRMRAYEVRALVIEADWAAIERGEWRSHLTPLQVKGALYSWSKHLSIFPTKDRASAAATVSGILFSAARDRWRELQGLYGTLKIIGGTSEQCEQTDSSRTAG